jgi:hypothetical protein
MLKLMTAKQLAENKKIIPTDIALINQVVKECLQDVDGLKANALRGYMMKLFDEMGSQERKDISNDAAVWLDGWEWALKFGVKEKTK